MSSEIFKSGSLSNLKAYTNGFLEPCHLVVVILYICT